MRTQQSGIAERNAVTGREHDLPTAKQAPALRSAAAGSTTSHGWRWRLTSQSRIVSMDCIFVFAGSRGLRGLRAAELPAKTLAVCPNLDYVLI